MKKKFPKKRLNIAEYMERIISASLSEDIGAGDITTDAIVKQGRKGRAVIVAKENLTVAGLAAAKSVFTRFDGAVKFKPLVKDGDTVKKGTMLANISGNLRSILTAERVALNFLQRLSGIATLTKEFIKRTEGINVKILDTRKTTPCMRILEKYAVKAGGGVNHRFGLFDAVIIKDNHIEAAGGVREAIKRVKKKHPRIPIEVEVKNLKEVLEALEQGVAIIMLDNMKTKEVKNAVKLISGRAFVEASGGITLKNIREFAETGVDCISIGALTHSARAVDISMEVCR